MKCLLENVTYKSLYQMPLLPVYFYSVVTLPYQTTHITWQQTFLIFKIFQGIARSLNVNTIELAARFVCALHCLFYILTLQ
jgi:hypothetical protein